MTSNVMQQRSAMFQFPNAHFMLPTN